MGSSSISRSSDLSRVVLNTIKEYNQYITYAMEPFKNFTSQDQGKIYKIWRNRNDVSICPAESIKAYIARTAKFRKNDDKEVLFITTKKPYTPLSAQRISKITLGLMRSSGIDTNIFKAHSLRSASSSLAINNGIPIEEVMRQGRWKSRRVFEEFYNRSSRPLNFSEAIFASSTSQPTN